MEEESDFAGSALSGTIISEEMHVASVTQQTTPSSSVLTERQAQSRMRAVAKSRDSQEHYSDTRSDISGRSALLETQRVQLAAAVQAKKQELKAQQRKQKLMAKEQEIAAMHRQLAELNGLLQGIQRTPSPPAAPQTKQTAQPGGECITN